MANLNLKGIRFVYTKHYLTDNTERQELIRSLGGVGMIVAAFTVNRHHKNGVELHLIGSNGIIVCANKKTHVIATELIARPGQLLRYGQMGLLNELTGRPWTCPVRLIHLAMERQRLGLNNV